jgi:hypothetical protein
MKIREYAEFVGHQIVGKLTRFPKGEACEGGSRKLRAYIDEAGNEYYVSERGVCIVTADGSVI